MEILKINGYRFNELTEKAQEQAIFNHFEIHFECEDDNGNVVWDYFADWSKDEQIQYCLENDYYFNEYGTQIKGVLK